MRKLWISAALLSALLTASCKNDTGETSTENLREEVKFKHEADLVIMRSGKTIKNLKVELADNAFETETGLMYRTSMEEDHGMLFVFQEVRERFFYMKNTEIALDILYIGEDMEIKKIAANAQPMDETSIPSGEPVKYVLEVNAGMTSKWGVEKGDSISYQTL